MAQNGSFDDGDIQSKIKASQGERQASQKKTFTKWMNAKLSQAPDTPLVEDLFVDLRDGNKLLSLLEVLTSEKLKRVRGKLRLHHLNNLNVAFDVLNAYQVKLVNISNTDIVDGEPIPTMGLVWSIIYKFQIQAALAYASKANLPGELLDNNNAMSRVQKQGEAENRLLKWCQYVTDGYKGVKIQNFTTSWTDGLAFNALLHAYRPDLFDYDKLLENDTQTNLEHAFNIGQEQIGVTKLLEPSDLLSGKPDSRTVVMYLSTVYENFRDMVPSKEIVEEDTVDAGMAPSADVEDFSASLQGQISSLQRLLESPAMEDKELPTSLQELLEMHIAFSAFLEDLQTHQEQVVNLVQKSEAILASDGLANSDRSFMASDIGVLKETWESVFDRVTDKQERISNALMSEILKSLEDGSQSLAEQKSSLNAFQENPVSLQDAVEKYESFKKYREKVEDVRSKVSKIRDDCAQALEAFDEEEQEEATQKIARVKQLLANFEEDLSSTGNRLANKLIYEIDKSQTALKEELEKIRGLLPEEDSVTKDRATLVADVEALQGVLSDAEQLEPNKKLVSDALDEVRKDDALADLHSSDPVLEKDIIEKDFKDTLDLLKDRINRLQSQVNSLDKSANDEYQNWVDRVNSLQEWLSLATSSQECSSPLSKDKNMLDSEKRRVEDYLADLDQKTNEYKELASDLAENILPKQMIAEDEPSILEFKEMEKKLNDLNRKYFKRQESVHGYLRAVSSDQNERFRQWQRKKRDMENALDEIKDKSPTPPSDNSTVDELEHVDKAYEGLLKSLEKFKEDLHDFAAFGRNLIEKELVDESDSKIVDRDIQELEDHYDIVLQCLTSDKRKNQGILLGLQHAERELIDEWYQRLDSVNGQVGAMDDKFNSFSDVNESNVEIVEAALKEDLQQLEVKVDNTTSFGEQLCRSPRLSTSGKSHISQDVLTIQSQWLKVKGRGGELQFAVQGELSKSSQVLHWKGSVEDALAWIVGKEKVIAAQDAAKELEALLKASHVLDQVSSEITDYQVKIDSITESGKVNLKLFSPGDKSAVAIRNDISALENKWEFLKEKCSAAALNAASMISLLRGKEDDKIREWEAKACKVEEWLEEAEDQANLFNQPSEDLIALEEQVSKHEELVFKVATEEKESDEILDWCNTLLSEDQITDSEKRDRVREQLRALRKRKNKLNVKLMAQQESLASKLDELLALEAEDMNAWLISSEKIDKEMDILLNSGDNPKALNAKEAIENVSQMKELCLAVKDLHDHIEKLSNKARKLVKERRLSRQKSEESRCETKRLMTKWEELEHIMQGRLARAEEELLLFKQEWKGQLSGWQAQSQVLSDWIHEMHKRLQETSKRDYTDMPFEEVVGLEKNLQDVNRKIQTKGEDLNDVLAEGSSIASGESSQVEDVSTQKDVQAAIHKLKEQWDDLLSSLDIEMKRLHDHLQKRFSTALADRLEEIDNLEVKSKTLPIVHNNQSSIRQCAEKLAEFSNQLSRLKPRIKLLQKYCQEILGTDLFTNREQSEIENSTSLLEESFTRLLEYAEEKRTGVQDLAVQRIRDEIRKTVEQLELTQEKQTLIIQHDKESTGDMKKLLAAQESVCETLKSIADDLAGLYTLCEELEGFTVLPEAEKGEIFEKMESLKDRCNQASEKGDAERENLYNTLLKLLRGRMDHISNTLDDIVEKVNGLPNEGEDLDGALEAFRLNEDNLEELDFIHKEAERLTHDVNNIVNENVLRKDDQLSVKEENTELVNRLVEVSNMAMSKGKRLRKLIKAMMKKRVELLWDWIRPMQKEKLEKTVIGPEVNAVKEQINEVMNKGKECDEVKLPVSYNDALSEEMLDTVTRSSMMEAEREWVIISDWLMERHNMLENAKKAWEDFRQKEIDLLDFLRAKEECIKTWKPIDLEKEEAVQRRMTELKKMNAEMEQRKNYVADLHQASNHLIDLIGVKSPTVNNIKSQVADIHDCWNGVVKQILETGSKLNVARSKLKNLEEGMKEVKTWLSDAQTVLNFYTDSVTEDVAKELMPQLELKCDEEPTKRTALEKVNSIGSELIEDVDGISHDVLESNISNLNKEWDHVTSELKERKMQNRKRPCCFWCWRRMFVKYQYY